jgi:predicted metalloprotease with PDZ domain
MRGSLLWVYEGQTQYWGWVLAARAGLIGKAQLLDLLAAVGDSQQTQPGRQWRSLQDTTNSEMLALHGGRGYNNWVRGVDYYWEGALIWLDADTLIREKSGGDRSLDDFARAFFGIDPGSMTPVTYRFEDIVAALNQVQPYDWAGFLRHRLDRHDGGAPLDGLTRAGYRLVYDETPNSYLLAADYESKNVTLMSSLGLVIGHDGLVGEVGWGSPAFSAGVIPGAQIIAVNSYGYEGADQIKAAITAAAKPGAPPIELLIKADDRYRMVSLDYHDGPHTPRLEPIPGATPWLDRIIEPKP